MEKAFQEHIELSSLRKSEALIFLMQGKALHDIKRDQKFLFANGGVSTWEEYLKQPEINLAKNQAEDMIAVYRFFCLDMGINMEDLARIPIKSVKYILKYAKEKKLSSEEIFHALEYAKTLIFSDLKELLFDHKSEKSKEQRTYEFLVMKRCKETNNISKVHEIDSDTIKNTFKLKEND